MSAFYVLLWTVHLEMFQISYSALSKNYIVHVNCKTAEKHYHFDNWSHKPTKVMHKKTNTYFMIDKVAFIQNYTDTIVQNFRFARAYQAQGFEV